jgi:transcriptional regulator GlxA family with amidase domain
VVGLRIGVLAYPGCFASEVFGVPDLLTMAGHLAAVEDPGRARYDVTVVSPRRRVVASGGSVLDVAPLRPVDVLVVPGFEIAPALDVDVVLDGLRPEVGCIRQQAAAGVAIVSICVGAFLVAEAGLLDGREATTAWLFAERFARRYGAVRLRPERLVVSDGGVTTTAAFSSMYDLALRLVREHDGPRVARGTARIALVDDARETQSPYVDAALVPAAGRDFTSGVRRWLRQHVQRAVRPAHRPPAGRLPLDVPAAARCAGPLHRFPVRSEFVEVAQLRRAPPLLRRLPRDGAGRTGCPWPAARRCPPPRHRPPTTRALSSRVAKLSLTVTTT